MKRPRDWDPRPPAEPKQYGRWRYFWLVAALGAVTGLVIARGIDLRDRSDFARLMTATGLDRPRPDDVIPAAPSTPRAPHVADAQFGQPGPPTRRN